MPDEGFTELAGSRVALRRFHPGDLATFVAYRSSEQVARFQSWDSPYPREAGERFIQQIARDHPDTAGEWFQFAVGLQATGQLIGDCAAMPQAADPASARSDLPSPRIIRAVAMPPRPCACS